MLAAQLLATLAFMAFFAASGWTQRVNLGTCYAKAGCFNPDHSITGVIKSEVALTNPCASFRALHTGGQLGKNCSKCPCPGSEPAQTGDACFNGVNRWCG